MSTAAEWADISPFPRRAGDDERRIGACSVTNLSWDQQRAAESAAPLFGGRRTWSAYAYETTGYGSLELCGPLAYRVTIVRPDDREVLRRHHRMVRSGRLNHAPYRWRRIDPSRLRVVDREELSRTQADAADSWLVAAQQVARACGADDEVARLAGPALRRLLWIGCDHLGAEHVAASFAELRGATEELAAARRLYRAALDRWVASGRRDQREARADLESEQQLVHGDIELIRLETRVLGAVRQDWGGTGIPDDDTRRALA